MSDYINNTHSDRTYLGSIGPLKLNFNLYSNLIFFSIISLHCNSYVHKHIFDMTSFQDKCYVFFMRVETYLQ